MRDRLPGKGSAGANERGLVRAGFGRRLRTKRVVLLVIVALAVVLTPAVAWALTSPRTEVHSPIDGEDVYGGLTVTGAATHRVGVARIGLVIAKLDERMYWNGSSWQTDFVRIPVPVDDPGAGKTTWSYSMRSRNLEPGRYRARAFAYSVEGNGDAYGGDWNEFVYISRLDPALYDTEITAPARGSEVNGPIIIEGIGTSTEGVASVRVVVRATDTHQYWNARKGVWQKRFVTVQADLSSSDGGTRSAWTVKIPAESVRPGEYFARAWVRTGTGKGDPFGRGQTNFTVPPTGGPTTTQPTTEPTTTRPATSEPTIAPPTTSASTTAVPTPPTSGTTTSTKRTTTSRATTSTTRRRSTTTTRATTTTTVAPTTTTSGPSGCRSRVATLEPCSGVLIGASGDFKDDNGRNIRKEDHFVARERELGQDFDIFHDFLQWNDLVDKQWPTTKGQAIADDGHTMFINWKSPTGNPEEWSDIANGSMDADIDRAARQVAAFGEPLFVTFFHEPEDDIRDHANGDAAKVQRYIDDYSAAFRHIHDRFDAAGADNVAWVWDMQGYLRNFEQYYLNGLYPGDDVVDWVGYNPYNWFGCVNHGSSTRWRSFPEVVSSFYDWLEEGGSNRPSRDKPVMLGEFGSEENTGAANSNQTKGQWIAEAQRVLPSQFPRMKAVVYFDTEGRRADDTVQFCEWGLDSSNGSLSAMRSMLGAPALNPVWSD